MHSNTYALDATWRPILKDLGLCAASVLRRAGLPEDLLAQSPVRLPAGDFHRFWNSMRAELGDPLFPLRLCRVLRSESFSPPLFAALCSPNFLVAAERIARYKPLVAPMRITLTAAPDRVTLEFAWLVDVEPPPPSLVATELLFFASLMRMGTREAVRPLHLATPEPPAPAEAYEEFLGARIEPGTGHRITFAQADALRPFLTAHDGMWAAFEPELRTRLAALDGPATLARRVRAVLLEALPSGVIGMEAVARRLLLSRRTLQRQLEAEGTSYLRELRETREALARHYLQKTRLPAAEISFLLGFDEPNSFYRAFRDWTGQTPDCVRRQGGIATAHERHDRHPMNEGTRSSR